MSTAIVPRLAELEGVIERGLSTFIEVGDALAAIREERLYRETHATFADYCRERWGFNDRRASQLIHAAQVSTVVEVQTERQARELAPLRDEPEQLREAWQEASANGEPTAARVREAVQRRRPTLVAPISDALLEQQQRETLIANLDRAVYALEGPPSAAHAEARRLLAGGDAGPFTPARFRRASTYCLAFAEALTEGGIADG